MYHVALFIYALLSFQGVSAAATSLYVPGFDPQPLSADIIGVDGDTTTWALQPGVNTDSSEDDSGLLGTVTLVESPDHVFLTYVYPNPDTPVTLGYDCTLQDGLAVCSGVADGATYTETETASPIEVQVGATAALSGNSSAPSNTGTRSDSSSGGVSETGAAAASPSSSQDTDASSMLIGSSQVALGAVAAVLSFYFCM